MKVNALCVTAGLAGSLMLCSAALAGFTGLDIRPVAGTPADLQVLQVWAGFTSEDDRLLSITQADIRTTGGGVLYQDGFGSATAPSSASVAVFADLQWDSFVTIGLSQVDGTDSTALDAGAAFTGPDGPTGFAGGWFKSDPDNDQGAPGAYGAPAGGDPGLFYVLIAQFTLQSPTPNAGLVGDMLVEWQAPGGNTTFEPVHFEVPAHGWVESDPDGFPGGPAPIDDSMLHDLPAGIWVRPFPDAAVPVPVTVQPVGTTFSVSSPLLGLLKSPIADQLWSGGVGLNIQTQLAPAAHGYDMTYVISNPTGQSVALPALWIPGHHLEQTIEYLHFQFGTRWEELVVPPFSLAVTEQNRYPRNRYAPVGVIRDSHVAIGVSLQYPVLQYKHDVSPEFRHYTYMDDVWAVSVGLDDDISPGESRTYKVMVRFALPEDWIHTLAPYRDYLWSVYGDRPRYVQDLRPIHGRAMASLSQITPDNLRGFITTWQMGQPYRVDLDGWEVEVNYVLNYLAGSGHKRLMMWTASGMYNEAVANNYAPQTLTEWSPPMVSTDGEWHRYQDAGIDLGFWHGRSGQIADQWNDPVLETLDISNPVHVATATNEYALAAQRGAASIGLDSFRKMDLWDAMPWLLNLQSQFPGLRFAAEPQCADILHIHIPFCTDHTNITTAPLLADYLVPGREVQIILTGEVSTLPHVYHSYGWGLTVLSYTQSLTASVMQPAVDLAQSGWVLPWDAPIPPVP
jgi:hypothetical protein